MAIFQVPADFQPESKAFRDKTAYSLRNRYLLFNRLALRKPCIKLIQEFVSLLTLKSFINPYSQAFPPAAPL